MTSDKYRPEPFRREYITDPAHLRRAAEVLVDTDAVGVDIEMGQRMRRKPGGIQEWKHFLALIQVAGNGLSIVVDPLRCNDLTPLAPLFRSGVRKVFLGGGQDVALLGQSELPVRTIVDVGEIAYAVFGRREDGMAALSMRIFGLSLDKTVRRTDWLVRPLNPGLITYAHQDAELTLLIYRWFQEHYPVVVALHERAELEPEIPPAAPDWLRASILRGTGDLEAIAAEYGLELERDAAQLTEDVRLLLQSSRNAPRRINRLVRVAGDLGLVELLPEILPLVDSPSSLLRASAARAIGKLAAAEEGNPILERLRADPIEDVRKAAEAGAKDLRARQRAPAATPLNEEAQEPGTSLDDSSLQALQDLMRRLEQA